MSSCRATNAKTGDAACVAAFPTREAVVARLAQMYRGAVVPVRLVVRKKHGFGWAFKQMREGKRVRRKSWSPEKYIHIVDGDLHAQTGLIVIIYGTTDLLATDWELSL